MIAAIYLIENKINNKVYIGQTINIISRLSAHLKQKKPNKNISNDLKYYDWSSYRFEVLEFINNRNDISEYLNKREQYYIDKYIRDGYSFDKQFYNAIKNIKNSKYKFTTDHRYNMSLSAKGKILSKEHRENLSKAAKKEYENSSNTLRLYNKDKKYRSVEHRKKVSIGIRKVMSIKILQYDLDGNFMNIHNTQIEAANSINIKKSYSINKCLKGISKQAYGYIWKYYSNNYSHKIKGIRRKIRVLDYDKHKFGIFNTVYDASVTTGVDQNQIYHAMRKSSKYHYSGGYYFTYIEPPL